MPLRCFFIFWPYELISKKKKRSNFSILTSCEANSGGVQEEAAFMKKPVLVLRTETERPEGVMAGNLHLVGTKTNNIVNMVTHFLMDENFYNKSINNKNPYGDGNASKRILEAILYDKDNS